MNVPRPLTRAARPFGLVAVILVMAAVPAHAQTSRFALDAVAAADIDRGSQVSRRATMWLDLFGAVRITDGLDLRVRPVVFRRTFDGTWQTQMYELALRYERPGDVGVRVDVGQFTSPIGLSLLENRPDKNPVVSQHSTLYLPTPRIEQGTPTTFLLAAAYPLGAKVTVSGTRWDARAAVVDSSPIRGRPFFGDNKPPRMANVVAGVGFTPYIGLRVGAAAATGEYADVTEVRNPARGNRRATLVQVEAEWAFRYTRVAGEWLWTRRELAAQDAKVEGGWIEVTQTFHPRVFGAVRFDEQWTKWIGAGDVRQRSPYHRLEAAAGLRLTREITLRAAYMTRKGYVVNFWDDQVLASIVFAKKML
jgi:hypothetical protein